MSLLPHCIGDRVIHVDQLLIFTIFIYINYCPIQFAYQI